MNDIVESRMWRMPGFAALAIELCAFAAAAILFAASLPGLEETSYPSFGFGVALLAFTLACVCTGGFFVVQPNEAKVFTFFGRYSGSVREAGFAWTNPLAKRRTVTLKVRNFSSQTLKVNDSQGNPIEIGAVIVWHVADSAKALYNVESYENFVTIQSETALRNLAGRFPYDSPDHLTASLRGSQDEVAGELKDYLHGRLAVAGVTVDEARLSHLAYAPEIAQAMLRRQQAAAVIAARRLIVDGAVGMVKLALHDLEEQGVVKLDEERKAAMVNNLLVALVSESEAQPVINTGSLYT